MATGDEARWRHLPTAAGATLLLWFILVTFGGGCLATYFATIGYFPKIGWQESITYLAVLSIIGGSIVVVFSLLAFLPGVVWAEALIADCILGDFLKYRRADKEWEPCLPTIWKVVGKPFAIFIFLSHVAVVGVLFAGDHDLLYGLVLLVVTASSLFLATHIFMKRVADILDHWEPKEPIEADDLSCKLNSYEVPSSLDSSRAKYRAAFIGSALSSLVALLIVEELLRAPAISPWIVIVVWVICVAAVVAANIVVAMLFGHRRWFAAALVGAFATVALLVLGELLEGGGSLLHRVMEAYGVGEDTHYVVVVGKEGRERLEAYGLKPEQVGTAERWRICDAAILSRLGDEFCFSCGELMVALPRESMPSWSKGDPATFPCHPAARCPRPHRQGRAARRGSTPTTAAVRPGAAPSSRRGW